MLTRVLYSIGVYARCIMLLFQKGLNYSQDGRGNRMVYHLVGCNMRCPWCANPEGIKVGGTLMTKNGIPRQTYHEYSVQSLIDEAVSLRGMFFDGGGVTLTGGEPTLQRDEALLLLKGLRDVGIHTTIETNATTKDIAKFVSLTDSMIMDFKTPNPSKHLEYTGIDIDIVKRNIAYALDNHPDVLVRTPLINGVNTSDEDMRAFVEFYTSHDTSRARFEFLKYHDYGAIKWAECSMPYLMPPTSHVDDEVVYKFRDYYLSHGLVVTNT